jgi:Domain of unknown function (DUF4259)
MQNQEPELVLRSIVQIAVDAWGTASFENDCASEWFLLVEEAVEPGAVIASALDTALGDADYLGLDTAYEAIAAAELSAACAGHAPDRLPDHVRRWVDGHPHLPHDYEIEQAILAVQRVRAESELRELWNEDVEGREDRWLGEIDDLIARLRRSGAGDPATISP